MFTEVVPKWDLHTFVNGVAYFASCYVLVFLITVYKDLKWVVYAYKSRVSIRVRRNIVCVSSPFIGTEDAQASGRVEGLGSRD